MNLSFLPHDSESFGFNSNCAVIDDSQGNLHVMARHVAPCSVNMTKPVSSIRHMTLNPDLRTYGPQVESVLHCDNRTALLYHYEDPRIIRKPDGGYIMSVCSWGGQYFDDGVNFHTAGHQIVYTLSPKFKVESEVHPVYGYNGVHHFANLVHEKNWLPFLYQNDLYFTYHVTPHKVFRVVDEYSTIEYVTDGVQGWDYGRPSGGTAPVAFDDRTSLVLFHSFTEEGVIRTYHVGAYLMENEPPFRIVRYTKKPLITANKDHTTSSKFFKQSQYFLGSTAPSSHKHHHAVVYPCGKVRQRDNWIAGCGINDITSGLLTFTTKEIEDAL